MNPTHLPHVPNAEQRHRAARVLAHYARDAADLADLLDMVGLTAEEGLHLALQEPEESAQHSARPAPDPAEVRRLSRVVLACYDAAPR
ncbi:hypothetical protein ABZ863_11010 [Saccharomonospora sp. NPDC046836]|uniref:hypothetical protein n=1 Tax=Saccharomonospora sp. NPDC046836 TaxID=3156921 RepID=UPI0033E0A62E